MRAANSALQHIVEQRVQWLGSLVGDSFDGLAILSLIWCGASGGHHRADADVCLSWSAVLTCSEPAAVLLEVAAYAASLANLC